MLSSYLGAFAGGNENGEFRRDGEFLSSLLVHYSVVIGASPLYLDTAGGVDRDRRVLCERK